MNIRIEFIPHDQQRYDTLGDWTYENEDLVIRSSIDEGEDQAFLVALHELVEVWLCRRAGIGQDEVDAFDLAYQGDGEPGDEPDAPYREQHRQAMLIEHLMANFMGLTSYGEVS